MLFSLVLGIVISLHESHASFKNPDGGNRFEGSIIRRTRKSEDMAFRQFTFKARCDYRGLDMPGGQTTLGSASDCLRRCEDTPHCTHITYNTVSRLCFLKHANTKQEALMTYAALDPAFCAFYNDANWYSMASTATQSTTTVTEVAHDRYFTIMTKCDYQGLDLPGEQKTLANASECVSQCYRTPNCTHITYNTINKLCFLKHAHTKQQALMTYVALDTAFCAHYNDEDRFDPATTTMATDESVTMSPQANAAEYFTINNNCDYHGLIIFVFIKIPSVDECAFKCYKMPRCTHFTYNGYNKICFLKHETLLQKILQMKKPQESIWCAHYNGEDRFDPVTTMTTPADSTTMSSQAIATEYFITYENCDYDGLDIFTFVKIPSLAECAFKCYKMLRCTHFTYQGFTKMCFLKHESLLHKIFQMKKPLESAWCAHYNSGDRFQSSSD